MQTETLKNNCSEVTNDCHINKSVLKHDTHQLSVSAQRVLNSLASPALAILVLLSICVFVCFSLFLNWKNK